MIAKAGTRKAGLLAWWDRHFAEFRQGLCEFSWLSFAVAAALAVVGIGLAGWFFSYATLSGPNGRFLASSAKDAEAHATWAALRLANRRDGRPLLLVLGSSITATAYADEKALADELKLATGEAWDVAILATPLQSVLDQMTLLEAVLGDAPGPASPVVVALGTSPMRHGYSASEILAREELGRLGLRSAWADAAVRANGGTPRARTGWYLLDNDRFVVANARAAVVRLATRRAAPRDFSSLAPVRRLPGEQVRRQNLARRIVVGESNADSLADTLGAELSRRLAAYPSVRLVYIDEAVNPEFLASAGLADEDEAVRGRFRAYAARRDVPYWEIAREVAPPPAVYFDDLHINSRPVQQAFRAALARRVAALDGAPHGR